jgi:hypothetical protein
MLTWFKAILTLGTNFFSPFSLVWYKPLAWIIAYSSAPPVKMAGIEVTIPRRLVA